MRRSWSSRALRVRSSAPRTRAPEGSCMYRRMRWLLRCFPFTAPAAAASVSQRCCASIVDLSCAAVGGVLRRFARAGRRWSPQVRSTPSEPKTPSAWRSVLRPTGRLTRHSATGALTVSPDPRPLLGPAWHREPGWCQPWTSVHGTTAGVFGRLPRPDWVHPGGGYLSGYCMLGELPVACGVG